jgi:protein ImuB
LRVAIEQPVFERALALEYPEDSLEPLLFLFSRLLRELCEDLDRQGFAADRLHLWLMLESRVPVERTLTLPFPVRSPVILAKLLHLHMEAHPIPAPVMRIEMRIEPTLPRNRQGGIFLAEAPQAENLEITLARLNRLIGEENVGRAELIDTHKPHAYTLRRFALSAPVFVPVEAVLPVSTEPCLTLRLYDPVISADVQQEDGHPARLQSSVATGKVVNWGGPWRISGNWWDGHAWNWEEWDIALVNKGIFRLVYDRLSRAWFLDGVYD